MLRYFRHINVNPLTLRFSGPMEKLEEAYQKDYLEASLTHIRVSLAAAAVFYAVFGFLDALLLPGEKELIWLIRFGFVCPAILLTVICFRYGLAQKWSQQILTLLIIISGSGIILMIIIAQPPVSYSYYAGLILIFMFGYTFIRAQFVWASTGAWCVVLLYEIAAVYSQTPLPVLINNNFFFIAANLLGMMACYSIELYSRHAFFLKRQLMKEKENVRSVNVGLERRIHGRTSELRQVNKQLEQEVLVRKSAQQKLSALVKDWQTTFDATNAVIWLINQDQVILRANKGTQTLFDRPAANVIGMTCCDIVPCVNKPMSDCPVNRAKKSLKHESAEYHLDDGWYEITADPILGPDGAYAGAVHIINNITEQKANEAQLRQVRKMESIGTLSGGIAHDFNNILSMVLGNAELALDEISPSHPLYRSLDTIRSASLRGAGIVSQLLNFSRKTEQKFKPVNAVHAIGDGLKLLRSIIPQTIEIQKSLPRENIIIQGDSIQISQLLINLCTNSFQAMEEDGGVLGVEVKSMVLETANESYPSGLSPGTYLELRVTDTGPGIPAEIRDRIFDPYFTTKQMGKGSGLGLSVVHGIVKNHNGMIQVNQANGKGASFTLWFPVIDAEPARLIQEHDELTFGSETILFVDDEAVITDMTTKILLRLGYGVDAFLDPDLALKRFKENPYRFDLVITDMTMPQMTGVTLSEKIMGIRSDIPVIICTGHSSLIDEEKSKRVGIRGYVMKPVSMSKLAKSIRMVLDR